MERMSLWELFGSLADPRHASGRRHGLGSLLTHAAVAMLGGARSLEAIAQFGRDRGESFAAAMGYTHRPLPCKATFHNVFKALGVTTFEKTLARWLAGRSAHGWRKLSIDGKALRGVTGEQLPGVHLLAAYAHETQSALGQLRVDAKTNEHKAALELLDILPVQGKLVMGDAAFCQRDLSRKVLKKR
jgi:hypothetical protein